LGERLSTYYDRYRVWLRSQTRDTSDYGYQYVSGLLRMDSDRNIANVARVGGVAEQNMQQFISDSPWAGYDLIAALQRDLAALPHFQQGSVLLADESAEQKAGECSAGAGRQHNGRLGKVEMSQVGVFVSLTKAGYQTWLDGELFLPEQWFTDEYAAQRQRVGLPTERVFQTKLELLVVMVKRAQANGVPFEAIDMDSLYGRSGWLRDELDRLGCEYYADVPANTQVFVECPAVTWQPAQRRGAAPKLTITGTSYTVQQVKAQLSPVSLTLRPNERGMLTAAFSRCRVWTVRDDGTLRQEWLLIRQDRKQTTYSLSNADPQIDLPTMAARKSQRYFVERTHQDAKSELGWDEFQAIKYRAWVHHLALTILASCFITETRLEWAQRFARDPALLQQYETDVLPALSVGNVRTLLQAALPLPQLTPFQAAELVVKHLDNRTRSRRSRLRQARSP
jgi:SRSO17 transposase